MKFFSPHPVLRSGLVALLTMSSMAISAEILYNAPLVPMYELRSNAASSQGRGSRLVVWQIYWINGTLTTSDYLAKVYSAFYRLTGQGDDSAVIVVYTPKDGIDNPEVLLESFIATNYSVINEVLQKTRSIK